jgi:hypothetical protein
MSIISYKLPEQAIETLPIVIEKSRREFGAHLTSVDIFQKFILPEIKNILNQHTWIDLFCGEGNLILPILEAIPYEKRINFFKEHIFLFDIQKEMVKKSIENAEQYGIPHNIAKQNIKVADTLKDYPKFIKNLKYPAFHITNPPYLYLGYIAKNSARNLEYFKGQNEGYQDLYQIALINDKRNGLENLIYIIPTNFLFGFSVSNKIRKDIFPFYNIKKAVVFEKKIFEFTGTNVCICLFQKKYNSLIEPVVFEALKINNKITKKNYYLDPSNFYRAGSEFDKFVSEAKFKKPIKIKFYLTLEELKKNKGRNKINLLDVNNNLNGYFSYYSYKVNQKFYRQLKNNPLFIRTLDTGRWEGRAGIYDAWEVFNVDGILVSKEKYRTHPIQIFLTPPMCKEDLFILKNYFNLILEHFRDITDSEFLTTFKYSNSDYTRKYLGLSQVKRLIETLPLNLMNTNEKNIMTNFIEKKNIVKIKDLLFELKDKEEKRLKLF